MPKDMLTTAVVCIHINKLQIPRGKITTAFNSTHNQNQ